MTQREYIDWDRYWFLYLIAAFVAVMMLAQCMPDREAKTYYQGPVEHKCWQEPGYESC